MTVRDLIIELAKNYPLDAQVSARVINTTGRDDVEIINVFPLYNKDGFVGVCLTNDPDED